MHSIRNASTLPYGWHFPTKQFSFTFVKYRLEAVTTTSTSHRYNIHVQLAYKFPTKNTQFVYYLLHLVSQAGSTGRLLCVAPGSYTIYTSPYQIFYLATYLSRGHHAPRAHHAMITCTDKPYLVRHIRWNVLEGSRMFSKVRTQWPRKGGGNLSS